MRSLSDKLGNPATKAVWDANVLGSNQNPYKENTSEWEEYEITFDEVMMTREREDANAA